MNNDEAIGRHDTPNKIIELKVNAMATMSESPTTVVLMLSPRYDEYGDDTKVIRQVFPVRLSREEGALYFNRLTTKLQEHQTRATVESAFLKHFGLMLDSVVLCIKEDRLVAEVFVQQGNAPMIQYVGRASECVVLAFLHDAPIFVEEHLLRQASKSLKMNFVDESGEKLSAESEEKILQNIISSGTDPDDLDDGVRLLLKGSTEEQLEHLKSFAIDKEFYEWAAYLTEIQPEDNDTDIENKI